MQATSSMNTLKLIILIFIALLFSRSSSAVKTWVLMEIGEQKQIPSPPSEQISINRRGIVKIQERPNSIILKARKKGLVFLDQGLSTKVIKVLSPPEKKNWQSFIDEVKKAPWLKWSFDESQIYVSGALYRFNLWQSLGRISKKNLVPWSLHAEVSNKVKTQALDFFKSQGAVFQIKWGKPVSVQTPKEFQNNSLFSSYGVLVQKDLNETIFSPPLVKIKILLTEASMDFSNILQAGGGVIKKPIEYIESALQKAESRGAGRIIAETELTAQSGEEAQFRVGGETPVHKHNFENKTSSISWKPYGLSITLTPLAVQSQKINLSFEVEFSEIDRAYSAQGSPALKNHRLASKITLQSGSTFLLSQLKRKQWGRSKKRSGMISFFPLLGQISSPSGFSKENTTASIFITPKIISSLKENNFSKTPPQKGAGFSTKEKPYLNTTQKGRKWIK